MPSDNPALTQDMIDAAVHPDLLPLYLDLFERNMIAADVPQAWAAFETALHACFDCAPASEDERRRLLLDLEGECGALANQMFDEGFKRGIAFTQWLVDLSLPEDARNAPTLTPTDWFISGRLLRSALDAPTGPGDAR